MPVSREQGTRRVGALTAGLAALSIAGVTGVAVAATHTSGSAATATSTTGNSASTNGNSSSTGGVVVQQAPAGAGSAATSSGS